MRRYLIGYLLAAVSVSSFASTFVCGIELTAHCGISPEVLSFLRFAIAGTALLLVELSTAKGRREVLHASSSADWCLYAWLGPIGTSVMAWCVFMGCARVSTANASMADALTPLLIFALSAIRVRRITRLQVLGVCFGFVGALLVVGIVSPAGVMLSAYSWGDFFIFLAAATWAVYSVCGRDNIRRLGAMPFTVWTMLIGAALMALVLPFGNYRWPQTPHAWGVVVVLGLVCTLLPFWSWNAAQRYLPISTLGMTAYFTPVVAVFLGVIFLHDAVTPCQWLGTLFVCASALVERSSLKKDAA